MGVINQPVPSPGNLGVADSSNLNGVLFPSASRSESDDLHGLGAGIYVTDELHNFNARGVALFFNATAGTGTVVMKIQIKDPASGEWFDLNNATTGTFDSDPTDGALLIYPGQQNNTNLTINVVLPMIWRVHVTVATAARTFSVGGIYLG